MRKALSIILPIVVVCMSFGSTLRLSAEDLPQVASVPKQPLLASINRLEEALEVIGDPLAADLRQQIELLKGQQDEAEITSKIQQLLDPMCLLAIQTQDNAPCNLFAGKNKPELLEQGWRTFLVKVVNDGQTAARLKISSPNALPLPHAPASEVESRWMQLSQYEGQPMRPNLRGLQLEYRIIQVYCASSGEKRGVFDVSIVGDKENSDLIRQWTFTEGTDGWYPMNNIEIAAHDSVLNVKSTGDDPFMGVNVEHTAGPMVLRFWGRTEADGMGQVFWWTKERNFPTGDRVSNFLLEPGKEHLYEIKFTTKQDLAGIRIDPFNTKGDMRIDWIELYSNEQPQKRASIEMKFQSVPAVPVHLTVRDADGLPAFARFEIRDEDGRIYPAQSKRLAPDLFFQQHIYRGNGESIMLPSGEYTVRCSRGPETIPIEKQIVVKQDPVELVYVIERWIDPSKYGWWSGDHHIHAAGCLHYENPTEGVKPEDMIRHIMGEDLKVGCCLTWGPCFDYQKRFFTGSVAEQSIYPYTLRYDVEVSGFGSHMSGHLNLLNLEQQIYPGGESKDHWPTLGLNTLRWAKSQGAICGPAHSAIGLTQIVGRLPETDGKDGPFGLPNYNVPAFDGIGANEFIMNVTHHVPGPEGRMVPAVDFISAMNTDRVAEWNMWYHVLNCGIRVAVSGETDFPCITGERVGMGRVYAKVDGKLTFDKWVQSIGAGRSYVSDGRVHLMDFKAASSAGDKYVEMGVDSSEIKITNDEELRLSALVGSKMPEANHVDVELIVNGFPVETKAVKTDGKTVQLSFNRKFDESCWVALRVFPFAHTNPIYVIVDDQPLAPQPDSVRWCLAGLNQCWESKRNTYSQAEKADAEAAYDHARKHYKEMLTSGN